MRFELIRPDRFPQLWQVIDPPLGLWFEGDSKNLSLLEKLPARGLAIVGTRDPSAQSLRDLERTMLSLRGYDLVILSGFACGIDRKAHEMAIEAGLPTIAIVGAGLDLDYPFGSRRLRSRIIESGGFIISEFPEKTPAYAGNFLQRNRLIAGWAKAVWVVEAGARSGTLNTAKWAREQHVDCYATPCYPGVSRFSGNQKLLEGEPTLSFWGPRSLGHTWAEFRSWAKPQPSSSIQDPFAREFHVELSKKTSAQGGAAVEQMVTWAIERGWSAGQVFQTLKHCLDSGWILDQGGVLSVR